MIECIKNNFEWIFSGIGVAIVGWLIRIGYARWTNRRIQDETVWSLQGEKIQRVRIKPKALTSYMPSFLLRVFLRPKSVSSKVRIALRNEQPIFPSLSSQVPYIDVYFEITNLSPLDLILDRMIVDVWFDQPTFQHTILRRYIIQAREITKGLHMRQELSPGQVDRIREFLNNAHSSRRINLYICAYFESRLGYVYVQKNIEQNIIHS